MKIIHTADLHLNSALTTRFNTNLAKQINDNVFLSLEKTIDFANKNNVEIIIISGDLFDNDKVAFAELERFSTLVKHNPSIKFIFIYGNHDYSQNKEFIQEDNFIFLQKGETLLIKNVCFATLPCNNLPQDTFNIVLAHGDVSSEINLPSLRDKNIDYLALGHIHYNKLEKLDFRGVWAYSGSLASRGFDECGDKGFYLIDTALKSYIFTKVNGITFEKIEVDISSFTDLNFYENLALVLPTFNPNLALKVRLYGEIKDLNVDLGYLKQKYSSCYFYIDFINETTFLSTSGSIVITEFLKVVASQNYTEEEQNKIINLGIKTLK